MRLPLLVGFKQSYFSSNQIVGFFDHQYLWKESLDILVFCIEVIIKLASEATTFVVGCGQFCFLSSKILGFFDNQYFFEELIILDFLRGDNHKGNLALETTFWVLICSDVLLVQSDCRILKSSVSLERILDYPHGVNHQEKIASDSATFLLIYSALPLVQSNCKILWSTHIWKESTDIFISCIE